jgi:hypothetical protein
MGWDPHTQRQRSVISENPPSLPTGSYFCARDGSDLLLCSSSSSSSRRASLCDAMRWPSQQHMKQFSRGRAMGSSTGGGLAYAAVSLVR